MDNNYRSSWDEEFDFEHTSLAVQIFSETCCNGCSCKTEEDHKPEN